ncbi:hypothetical protein V2G26_013623 [Clonostachys chloroleuca]
MLNQFLFRSPYDFVQPSRFLKCYRNRIQYRRLICESCRGPDNNITYKSYCQDLLDKIQFIQERSTSDDFQNAGRATIKRHNTCCLHNGIDTCICSLHGGASNRRHSVKIHRKASPFIWQ